MQQEFEKIIIRMPNWVGDLVMATPIIKDVRMRFPKAEITVMTLKTFAPLLLGNPYLNEIFTFSRRNEFLKREEKRDINLRLRQGKYDLGILLTNSFSSALWFWHGRVRFRLGFKAHGRSILLNRAVSLPPERGREHLVTTFKRLLTPIGIPLSENAPELFVSEDEKKQVRRILEEHRVIQRSPLIGINPTSAYGPAKNWPEEKFRNCAKELLKNNPEATLLFFSDESGASIVRRICQGLPVRAVNLAGMTTLRELVALISICDLFITNDSGPMHIAEALKTPLIALFGSTSEVATGPYRHGLVLRKEGVACAPCFLRTCPIDFRCMQGITVEEVVHAADKLLSKVKDKSMKFVSLAT